MHELSVAQSILDLVGQHVPPARAADVRAVRVRVGALSGVLGDSLEFCFSALADASPFRSAFLVVDRVPARAACLACGACFAAEEALPVCPGCGGGRVHVAGGADLQVADLELEEPPA